MILPAYIAKAALFNEVGEVLLLTRSATDDTRPGEYDFPGGSLEHGESPTDGVLREIEEEIGAVVATDQIDLMYATTDYYDDKSRVRFLFVGRLSSDQNIQLSYEHSDYKWVDYDTLIEAYNHPIWVGGLSYLKENNLL